MLIVYKHYCVDNTTQPIKRDRINVLFPIINEGSRRLAGGAADVIAWRWTALKVDDVFTFSLAFADDSPVVV